MKVASITEAAISQGLNLGAHSPGAEAGLDRAANRNRSAKVLIQVSYARS